MKLSKIPNIFASACLTMFFYGQQCIWQQIKWLYPCGFPEVGEFDVPVSSCICSSFFTKMLLNTLLFHFIRAKHLLSLKTLQEPFFQQFQRPNSFWTWSHRKFGYSVRTFSCDCCWVLLVFWVMLLVCYSFIFWCLPFFNFGTGIFPTMNSMDQFLLPLVILSIFLHCMLSQPL